MGRRSQQTFSQRRHTDGQQVHEKMPDISDHQGNALAVTIKLRDNNCWQQCGEKGTLPCPLLVGRQVQLLWKTVWRLLKKLKIELPGLLLWLNRLRIWRCHCKGSGPTPGLGLGTFTCHGHSQKKERELLYDPAIPLLGIYLKIIIWKDIYTPVFTPALFIVANMGNNLSVHQWINTHTHTMEPYSAMKNEILPFAVTWMDSECIMLRKIRQRKTNTL